MPLQDSFNMTPKLSFRWEGLNRFSAEVLLLPNSVLKFSLQMRQKSLGLAAFFTIFFGVADIIYKAPSRQLRRYVSLFWSNTWNWQLLQCRLRCEPIGQSNVNLSNFRRILIGREFVLKVGGYQNKIALRAGSPFPFSPSPSSSASPFHTPPPSLKSQAMQAMFISESFN